jgi:hypothetical protein
MYRIILALVFISLLWGGVAKAQTIADDLVGLGMPAEQAEYIAGTVAGGTALGNNTYLKATDAAGSGTISLLKANATDDTVLNSDSGDPIIFQSGGDANRLMTYYWSADATGGFTFGDSGTTATQIFTISASTSDADDDSSLVLAGGGAATSNGTRGAIITLPGEEVAGGSDITYNAGAGDTHIFQVAGTTEATISDDALTFAGAAASLAFGATSGTISSGGSVILKSANDANRLMTFNAASDTAFTLTFGDGTAGQQLDISTADADASDDGVLTLNGGGAYNGGGSRGAWVSLGGNESTGAGDAVLSAGSASGSTLTIGAPASNGSIDMQVNGQSRWNYEADGDLTNNASNGGNLLLAKTGTTLAIDSGTAASACTGTATANGTTAVTVSTTCATSGAHIFLSAITDGTGAAGNDQGDCWATNIVAGTSFDLDCPDANNNADYNWLIIKEG